MKKESQFNWSSQRLTKKQIIVIALVWLSLIGCAASCLAQTVVKDAAGNYHQVKTEPKGGSKAMSTGQTFTDAKGTVYPIFKSVNGKLFYVKISKSGNSYNVYLKTN